MIGRDYVFVFICHPSINTISFLLLGFQRLGAVSQYHRCQQQQIIMKVIVIWVLLFIAKSEDCHYSCETCAEEFYQYCLTCPNQNKITVIEDPLEIPKQFRSSSYPTGLCQGKVSGQPNAFGIIFVITVFAGLIGTRSKKLFYLIYTLQTISIFALLEVPWLVPSSYFLAGLQYLTPFNLIMGSSKQPTWAFRQESFYRLHEFFKRSEIESSLSLLGIFNIIVIAFLIIIPLFRIAKRRFCDGGSCKCFCFAQWALDRYASVLLVLFFFMIQETFMSIYVGYRFSQNASSFLIAVTVVYSIMIVFYIGYVYKMKISFFPNRYVQYHNIIKKIIYPVFVIVEFQTQHLIFVVMLLNVAIEIAFDRKANMYPLRSTQTIYKFLETLTILLCMVYYLVDRSENNQSSTKIAGYFFTVSLVGLILCCYMEIGIKIYQDLNKPKESKNAVANLIPQNSVSNKHKTTSLNLTEVQEVTESDLFSGGKKKPSKVQSEIEEVIDSELAESQGYKINEQIKQEKKEENVKAEDREIEEGDEGKSPERKRYRPARLSKDPEIEERKKKMKQQLMKRYDIS